MKKVLRLWIVICITFVLSVKICAEDQRTPSFLYIDDECGATFLVPENWTQEQTEEDNEYIDAHFSSNLNEERSILYASTDLWSQLPEEEKKGCSRSEVDNAIFSQIDIAKWLGVTEDKVSVVAYGDKEYYRAEYLASTSVNGLDITMEITCLIRCENGYMFTFQFSGLNSDEYYKDFESLISSVQYQSVAEEQKNQDNHEKTGALEEKEGQEERKTSSIISSWIGSFVSGLFLTVMLHPLPIWIYRYLIKKEPISPRKAKIITVIDALVVFVIMEFITLSSGGRASSSAIILWSFVCYRALTNGYYDAVNRSEDEQTGASSDCEPGSFGVNETGEQFQGKWNDNELLKTDIEPQFCCKCGKSLLPDSIFCSQCGAKIPR